MSRFRPVLASATLAVGLGLFGAPLPQASAAAAPRYTADVIGESGPRAIGSALNEEGQVTGWLEAGPGSAQQAFVWGRQTGLLGLGTLGGTSSMARDINDRGQIVGSYQLANGRSHAFIYDQGAVRALDTPGALSSWANGINAGGQMTGTVELADGVPRPFVHDGSTMQIVDGTDCCHRANAINDLGDIVGSSQASVWSYPNAFAYRGGQFTNLGTLPGGMMSWAYDINNRGQVVGTAEYGDLFGFIWNPESQQMHRIDSFEAGVLTRSAMAINEHGDVVGRLTDHSGARDGAYLLSDGKVVDLQGLLDPTVSARWVLNDAYDINDRGQILVSAYDPSSWDYRTLLLTPVPEPETVVLMSAGLLLLGLKARRRAG
ncbi:PEP-CTERM sorting domain-containing protein [Schlegelella sp. S2-27]|uniref:PEP-CTERM sorting domain-containing protein n=1 Tax=Caldimonas mangrovi TaxID=2944811 RepID=A0ABT0YLF7_9BURK|nr:PEP-CTERM sorting domain-containing protein [Caldimonas mangrovi]MCM5679565.1 PEP-CTERM sorting domain-containing protein [Caldimonas mangrovi]